MKDKNDYVATFDNLPVVVDRMSRKIDRMERMMENIQPIREDESKPLNLKECSQFTGLAIPTIYSKTCKGQIPFHKNKGSKHLWFFKHELLEWMRGGKAESDVSDPKDVLRLLKPRKQKGGSHD